MSTEPRTSIIRSSRRPAMWLVIDLDPAEGRYASKYSERTPPLLLAAGSPSIEGSDQFYALQAGHDDQHAKVDSVPPDYCPRVQFIGWSSSASSWRECFSVVLVPFESSWSKAGRPAFEVEDSEEPTYKDPLVKGTYQKSRSRRRVFPHS